MNTNFDLNKHSIHDNRTIRFEYMHFDDQKFLLKTSISTFSNATEDQLGKKERKVTISKHKTVAFFSCLSGQWGLVS